jgi:hypothetical protein
MRTVSCCLSLCLALLAAGRGDAFQKEQIVPRPPATEIHVQLNTLVASLGSAATKDVPDSEPALEVKVLDALNIGRTEGANLTILRRAGRLTWPDALAEDELTRERKQLEEGLARLAGLVRSGKDISMAMKEVQQGRGVLLKKLEDRVNDVATGHYIQALRFLRDLEAATKAVGTPAGTAELKVLDTLASKGRTPSELARFLCEHKLKIGRALYNDEGAYEVVRRALTEELNKREKK